MSLLYDDDSDFSGDEEPVSNVHLGLADGPLEHDDEFNPLVSRLGGRPAWLPVSPECVPSSSAVECAHCHQPMPLLLQIFAPLEDSAYDRNLFVWSCPRAKCQRQGQGSIKAIRMLKHNARWAAKLEKQAQRRRQREERAAARKQAEEAAEAERVHLEWEKNPFSMAASSGPTLFGSNLFGSIPAAAANKSGEDAKDITSDEAGEDDQSEDDEDFTEDDRLAEELAMKASLEEQRAQLPEDWARSALHYQQPLYLNTIPEPLPSDGQDGQADEEHNDDDDEDQANAVPQISSGEGEQYEKMMLDGIDEVFERFARRLGSHSSQVVRYEHGGQPLPFSAAGPLFRKLWPQGLHGGFDASSVPACEKCGAPRVFEVQLMPNLANLLRKEQLSDAAAESGADDQRQTEIASLLGLKDAASSDIRTGIAWSTAMVFVCSKDCCQQSESWTEEWVDVQHETEM